MNSIDGCGGLGIGGGAPEIVTGGRDGTKAAYICITMCQHTAVRRHWRAFFLAIYSHITLATRWWCCSLD